MRIVVLLMKVDESLLDLAYLQDEEDDAWKSSICLIHNTKQRHQSLSEVLNGGSI
jgi:hypothetical protein